MTQQPQKIMIVDDEEDVVQLLAKRLKASGFQVDTYFEGEGAFEKIRDAGPHLLLLDIWLPGISGIDIFKRLRSEGETRDIPVVFFSADTFQEDFCLNQLKAEGFIKKPYSPAQLLETVHRIFSASA